LRAWGFSVDDRPEMMFSDKEHLTEWLLACEDLPNAIVMVSIKAKDCFERGCGWPVGRLSSCYPMRMTS